MLYKKMKNFIWEDTSLIDPDFDNETLSVFNTKEVKMRKDLKNPKKRFFQRMSPLQIDKN